METEHERKCKYLDVERGERIANWPESYLQRKAKAAHTGNPDQKICDLAESLWATFQESGKDKDRDAYLRHVEECPLCFVYLRR